MREAWGGRGNGVTEHVAKGYEYSTSEGGGFAVAPVSRIPHKLLVVMYSTVRTSNFLASKTKCAVPCMGSET